MTKSSNVLVKIVALATIFASVVVMLGAWTRLVDAGLGCPDWPGCYGFISVPQSSADIAVAEARFPHAPVEVHKGWPEMIHRYFAGTLGLIILGLSVVAVRQRREQASTERQSVLPLKHTLGLLILVTCQAAFGMWTVTLKLWPQVVSAHLLGGFATLSLLFLLALRLRFNTPIYVSSVLDRLPALKAAAMVGLILAVVQIFLGAWTASNYAALACGSELPGCQGQLWPHMDIASGFNFFQTIGPNYLGGLLNDEGRVAIQMFHRVGALVLTIYLCSMLWMIKRSIPLREVGLSIAGVFSVLLIQVLLGLSNVIWLIPLSVAVAHNAVGALLLMALVNLTFQLSRIQQK